MIAATAGFIAIGGAADAKCSNKAIKQNWNFQSDDVRISGKFLEKTVIGKLVSYGDEGTEHYGADGSYFYKSNEGKWDAKGVVYYKDGSRCLDYANGPRYDMYVVNNKRLVLINGHGGRLEAKIAK